MYSRRDLFAFLHRKAKEAAEELLATSLQSILGTEATPRTELPKHLPSQRLRLAKVLPRLGKAEEEELPTSRAPFYLLEINDACTACGLCAKLCPTGALAFTAKEGSFTLEFIPLACVGCDVCALICPVDAIELRSPVRPLDFLKAMKVVLQEGKLLPCEECGIPFKPHGEEQLCHTCRLKKERFMEMGNELVG